MKIKIVNARLVNEGEERHGDLLIEGDRIAAVGGEISAEADQVIDAAGLILMPGMIDDQVHFREPGLTHKGDFATESRAAAAGGITSFMEMPNTAPPTTDADALADKYRRAEGRAWGNFAFYLGATNDNLEEIRRLDPRSASGIKVFMGASTGNMLVDSPETLDGIFAHAPVPVITHCEDTPTILKNLERARQRYPDGIPAEAHPEIRDVEACMKSSELAVSLARRHGTQLHVLHLTTAEEMQHFAPGPVEDKQITAEVCVHHLHFSADDYDRHQHLIKCNPSIKAPRHREALWEAVLDGRIDIIATDHAPHTLPEKTGDYEQAAAGLPLVQDALECLLAHVDERFTLPLLVEKVCHNPARRFAVRERGFLREGYFADLVLLDPSQPRTVRRQDVLSKCGWSPFEGERFDTSVAMTMVNGRRVYERGQFFEPAGQRLVFDR